MNEWDDANVTATELPADELADSTAEDSQEQTESEQTTTAAPLTETESRVNTPAPTLDELRALIAEETRRGVQSELAKRRNRADAQLAQKKSVYAADVEAGEMDEATAKRLIASAEAEAKRQRKVWDVEEDTMPQPIPTQANAPIVPRATIVSYLQGQGLAQTEIENISGRYAGLPDTPQNAQAFMAEVQAAQQRRTQAPPSQEQRVVQQFGSTAAPVGRNGGTAYDARKELDRMNNEDPPDDPHEMLKWQERRDKMKAEVRAKGEL